MTRFTDWAQWGAGHILLGLAQQALIAPVAALLLVKLAVLPVLLSALIAIWISYAMQQWWWFSRESRDYGIKAKLDPHRKWYAALAFWRWTKSDTWWPLGANGLVTAIAHWLLVRWLG